MEANTSSVPTRIPSDNIISFPHVCSKCGYQLQEGWKVCPMCCKSLTAPARKHIKRANGTGTVYRMHGRRKKPWIAQKNKVTIGYFETKKEALAALDRLIDARVTADYNLTFAQVYEKWSAEHFQGIADSRKRVYKMAYSKFTAIYNRKFRDLRATDFQACVDSAGIGTVDVLKQLVTSMYKWAIQNEICSTDYGQFIRIPKQERAEKKIFTQEEIDKLVQDGSDDAKIALMMIYTGMRVGELFSLKIEDYHGIYCIGGEKTDAGKNRIIPIAPQARAYFSYFAAKGGTRLIDAMSADSYREYHYKPMLKRLEIEYKSPHSCRHTFASMMAASGMDPNVLKKIMGHADISTTANVYIHTGDEALMHALDNFK